MNKPERELEQNVNKNCTQVYATRAKRRYKSTPYAPTPLWAPRAKSLKSLNKSEHFFTKKRIFSLASCQAFPYTLNHDEDMEMDDWRVGRRP